MAKNQTDYEGYTDAEKLLALVGSADWNEIAPHLERATKFSTWDGFELLRQICRIVRPDLLEGEDE